MAVYQGPPHSFGLISLAEPKPRQLLTALAAADLADSEKDWFSRAKSDEACFFFAVQRQGKLIGQIFLHDVDWKKKEALISYHLFQPEDRGQGYGTAALRALCDYAFGELALGRMAVITPRDNAASRRIAAKCGFREIGTPREGPNLVVCERLAG